MRLGLALQVFQEFLGALTRVGHAIVQHQVRKIAETQQFGFGAAQFQDAAQQVTVVVLALAGPDGVSAIHLLADCGVIQVHHDGHVAGRLQSESPARQTLVFGAGARRGHSRWRQSGQPGFIRD